MQTLKLTVLLLMSVATLTACNSKPSAETITTQGNISNSYTEGDIYDMTYKICGQDCNVRTSQIVTWGKPTEIGIAYYANGFPEQNYGYQKIEKMQDRQGITLVVKCKGTLPGMEKPIETARFAPVEHFLNVAFRPFTKIEAAKAPSGSIQIISITKLNRTQAESPVVTAAKDLKTKVRDENMIEGRYVAAHLSLTKNEPDMIPQQVEKITWQEGQPPQVITLKAW
jgi:hypothetical protein